MTVATRRLFPKIAGALLGVSMLLLVHRYWGIDHDATLYLGESLRQLRPGIFGKDLYFAYGSQGEYTLFPWLLARLMAWVDPVPLFLIGGLVGLLAFAWASWACLSALLPTEQRYWAWLGVLCLPTFYGRTVIFGYAEPFLTPRPFAEALSLLAFAFAVRGKKWRTLGCLGVAALLHPLQGLTAGLVLWSWAVIRDRRWLHALWLLLPIMALALAGAAPFDGLLRRVDPAWWAELRGVTGQLFVTGWPQLDYQYMAFDAALLAITWQLRRDGYGQASAAALAGLLIGVGTSLLLVDGLHLVLPTGLQLWRVHWLAHWVAMGGFALLLHRDLSGGARGRAILLGLTGLLAWGSMPWAWVPFVLLYVAWPEMSTRLRPRTMRLLAGLFGTMALLLMAQHAAMEWIPFRLSGYRLSQFALDRRLLAFPLLAMGLPLLLLHGWNRCAPERRWILLLLVVLPLSATAAWRWDIRTPKRQAVEAAAGRSDIFGHALPEGALVYWHDMSLVAPWLILGRADYYDPQQLSGLAFQRGTIFEARRRIARLSGMLNGLNACDADPRIDVTRDCPLPTSTLVRACSPGGGTAPDFLVLPYRLPLPNAGTWRAITPTAGDAANVYWLYGCHEILASLPPRKQSEPTQ